MKIVERAFAKKGVSASFNNNNQSSLSAAKSILS